MKMSKDTPYGLALLLSGIVLMAFAAVVFIGLSGMCQGQLVIPAVIVIAGVLIVFYSLIRICKSKLGRSLKKGLMSEMLTAIVILVIMMCGASPASNMISSFDGKKNLQADVDSIVEEVSNLPQAYRDYVDDRAKSYSSHLLSLQPGSEDYETQLARAAGDTRQEKARRIVASLKRRLLNDEMEKIEMKRAEWLSSITDADALNRRTASAVAAAGLKWIDEYREISTIEYKGENADEFEMPELEEKLSLYDIDHIDLLSPSGKGLLATLLCYLLVLVPYFLIRRSGKAKSGTHD